MGRASQEFRSTHRGWIRGVERHPDNQVELKRMLGDVDAMGAPRRVICHRTSGDLHFRQLYYADGHSVWYSFKEPSNRDCNCTLL